MNKRILSLVLALVMVLGTFAVVSAEEAKVENISQANKIQWLVDNKIVEGHKINEKDTDLDLEGTLTREQATKLIVHIIGKADLAEVLQGVMKPFPDVDTERWSNGVISVARTEKGKNGQPIVIGYEDGYFRPTKELSYAELATMLVRIVKDDLTNKMVENAVWATSWMRWAKEEGILRGLTIANSDAPISRRDAFEMIYNTKVALGETKYNNVSFGDKMGIVSKMAAGKIEINQDKDMTYNITYNTVFTDQTNLWNLANNTVRPGSLVRLITDAEGNVLYLIELGNYKDGAIAGRWETVADKTVSVMTAYEKGKDINEYVEFIGGSSKLSFHKATNELGKIVTEDLNVVTGTRVFVSDPANNFLKEVDSVTTAMRYVTKDADGKWVNDRAYQVYAGYDKTAWGNEARVIVFNATHKGNFVGKTLRVVTPGSNSFHNTLLENTKGERVNANSGEYFPENWFPGNKIFEYMDVVSLTFFPETDKIGAGFAKLIDYSEDDVFGVDKIDYKQRTVTLIDKNDRKETFILAPGFDEFLEGQLGRMNVQIALGDNKHDMRVIEVISNVNLPRRGLLNAKAEMPEVIKNALVKDFGQNNVVYIEYVYNDYGDKKVAKFEYADGLKDKLEIGKRYNLTISANEAGYKYTAIVEAVKTADQQAKDNKAFIDNQKAIPKEMLKDKITDANFGNEAKVKILRARLVEAIDLYAEADKTNTEVMEQAGYLNNKINAFNNLELVKTFKLVEKLEKVDNAE